MATMKVDGQAVNEIAIVNILTKLILDADAELSDTEEMILALLLEVDPSVAHDSRADVSNHLRTMGVDDMINVVGSIQDLIDQQQASDTVSQPSFRHH
jgi:hypothetical protein